MKQKQNFLNVFKLIWKISDKKSKFILVGLFFLSVLRTLTELLPPIITAVIIAKVQNLPYSIFGLTFAMNLPIISLVALAFGSLFSFAMIGSGIRAMIKLFGTKCMGNMNVYAVNSILENANQNTTYTNGEIAYIIKNSAESIPNFIEVFLVKFFVPIITTFVTVAYIASVSLISFAIVLATIILLFLVVFYRVYRNKIILNKIEKVNGKLNNTILNDIDNLGFINFYNTKAHELSIFRALNQEYYKHEKKKNWVYLLYWIMIYVLEFACSILVVYFALKTIGTDLIASVIILLVPYLIKIYSSTESLGYIIVELQQYAIKILRINNVIESYKKDTIKPDFSTDCKQIEEVIKEIKVDNFEKHFDKFSCSANDITFKRGQINCIVGQSGSGKTTLIKCILGLQSYNKAKIIVNGNEVENLLEYSNKISIAFQDENFFDRSIIENIAYPESKLNDKAKSLVKYFGLSDLVKRDMTENISSSSFKNKFSGGEKKRMALARALSKEAEIYVLDEPTNELDKKNVQKVVDLLSKIKENCMLIVISHDNRIVEISENIVVLNNNQKNN